MRQGFRVLGRAALLPLLAGCFELGPLFGPEVFAPSSGGCWFCISYDIVVEGSSVTLLKGDTTRVRVLSSMGHDRGTFTVTGSALRLVNGNTLTTEITTPASDVRVVAIAAGRDTVQSRAADTAATVRLALRVVDSASVTDIQTGLEPSPKIRVGDVRQLGVYLYVGQDIVFGGPTSMSVSNAAVLSAEPAQLNPKGIFLRAKAVGTSTLVVRFLEQSRTYQVEVTP